MDKVQVSIARHGNIWTLQTNSDMVELYEPLHAAQLSQFKDTVKVQKGLKYGDHARSRLDVYTPAMQPPGSQLPVIVFFHGGGFTSGDTDITPCMHGNLGNYFASNACVSVLVTYRLLPEARYPSGGQDVAQALRWVQEHIDEHGGNPKMITAAGQSAGGAHLASAIYGGLLKEAGVGIYNAVLLSPPLWYDLRQERRRKNMVLYHGTEKEDEILAMAGVAVLESTEVVDEPNLLVMVAEFDSEEIVEGNLAFLKAYQKKRGRLPLFEIMRNHNHISNTLAIGLPGDTVGSRILAFATQIL